MYQILNMEFTGQALRNAFGLRLDLKLCCSIFFRTYRMRIDAECTTIARRPSPITSLNGWLPESWEQLGHSVSRVALGNMCQRHSRASMSYSYAEAIRLGRHARDCCRRDLSL